MRQVLGAVGRALVTVGLLLLLFVAYQLWGTGLYTAQAQNDLQDQFHEQQRAATTSTTTTPTATTTPGSDDPTVSTPTTLAPFAAPPEGDVVGRILIPKIGIDKWVVEGVNVDDLRKGPGHYPSTQMPGHEGNSAIAGHRTTYDHPFGDLDQIGVGDEIRVVTLQGDFHYKVTEQRVVDPSEVSVLDPTPDPERAGHQLATLTLTTCNPKYSAEQRLIIKAQLQLTADQTAPLPPTKVKGGAQATTIGGLSGESSSRAPTILWGAIALAIGLLWWLLFHRHPRWTTWLIGVLPFLAALFVAYTYLERLLPSNY
jgi:sortase A